jgi:hypothetical protein
MNMKRMRGRNHRPGGGGGGGGGGFRNQQNGIPLNRNHVFDSSGPEMRVRGTAQQLYDKYQQLARDASSNGDRVTGEAYYQHAEHYFRIISAINQAQGLNQGPGGQPSGQAQERSGYQPQHGGGQGEYQRREMSIGDQNELPIDSRHEHRENREPRENRQEPRRFEQRPYEQRQRQEFQRPERQEQRFRPEQMVDTRIDISSALEAELAAATAEPAGLGEQPVIQQVIKPVETAPEPRAIPIIPDAPPPQVEVAAPGAPSRRRATLEEQQPSLIEVAAPDAPAAAPRTPRPRGRPRLAKTTPKVE